MADPGSPDSDPKHWQPATEALTYQFGPWVFARWSFTSLTNRTNPLLQPDAPVESPPVLQPVTYQQMRDHRPISRTLSWERNAIRYVAYRGKRYFIDLRLGSFDDYLRKFSAKTRNTLKRKRRNFAKVSGGIIDLRTYGSPKELEEFCRFATAISRVSYQGKIGFGFPEGKEFTELLIEESRQGRVRGFVLMHTNQPVSYVLCRINCDIITYSIPGYDPEFVRFSPGAVLLYLIIEKLFNERRFRIFDFGGQEWDYKALLATGTVAYSKVIWFPLTAKYVSLVTAHYLLWLGWRSASRARTGCSNIRRRVANYFLSKLAKGGETLRVSKSIAAFFSCAETGQKQAPLNRRPQ